MKAIIAEGDQAAVFVELETTAPADATTFVAEWMRIANGRIQRVQSAFERAVLRRDVRRLSNRYRRPGFARPGTMSLGRVPSRQAR